MPLQLSSDGPETNSYDVNGSSAQFQTRLFYGNNGSAHLVLSKGEMVPNTHVRMASECTLAQGGPASVLCDCGSQLRKTLSQMASQDESQVLVYSMGQGFEGRGVGVVDHFRAYILHTQLGLSSPEAYKALGNEVDPRSYAEPAEILRGMLDKTPFILGTNNRSKRRALELAGLKPKRQGFEVDVTEHNAGQVLSRIIGMGHRFSAKAKSQVESMGIQLKTVEDCQAEGLDLHVEPEQIATNVQRYGPVTLPLAMNRQDDDDVARRQIYLYICDDRLYHVVTGSEHPSAEAEVAALPSCLPGDNFASMRCGCRLQIRKVMKSLHRQPEKTVFIYAITHHSTNKHAPIHLGDIRDHAFNGVHQRTPIDHSHPDVKIILESLGVAHGSPLSME